MKLNYSHQPTIFQKILMAFDLGLIFLIAIFGSKLGFSLMGFQPISNKQLPTEMIEPTPSPTPTPQPKISPLSLDIPALEINANIVSVGITENQNMDVPSDTSTVGWYVYGSRPGEEGSVILTAHYDTPTGKPALFYNLQDLKTGDQIKILDSNQVIHAYQVQEVNSYPLDTPPLDLIYNQTGENKLILITCDGIFNPRTQLYSKRLVVTAKPWQNKAI